MRSAKIGSGIGVLLLFASLPAAPALAAAQQSWRAIGQIGGPTQGVAVQGHYAYVGVGLRLVTLDISNAADIREVGVTPPFPHFVEDVAVSGTVAYVAAGGSGLRVVDISNPALPTEVGAWDSRGYANGVAVAGSIAYLADGPYGLRVVDVSKPSRPVEVGSAYPVNYAFKVAVQGRYAFIAAAGAGLLIADVTDPRHPVEVGRWSSDGYAYGVAVAGSTAYVADGWEGLKIVSVTNPGKPVLTGAYKTPGWAFGVAVADNKAYVADAIGGLRVIDVSDTAHPVEVARAEMPKGNAANVAVADGVAYVTDRFVGLHAVSLSGASSLSQIGSYRSLPYADAVAAAGNRAYVGTNLGLAVVDVSDPARPRQSGDLDLGGYATSVSVWGQWACVAMGGGGGAGLRMVDLSDPAHPATVATHLRAPGMYRDMVVSEGIAYSANEWGLEMVRISDPLHPEWLGFLQMQTEGNFAADTVVGVAVSGTMAYTASTWAGLEIVDVSDPRNPVWKGAFTAAGMQAQDVAVAGNRAYLAGFVVDVSDPAHPAGMGHVATPGHGYGVAVAGNLAYVADGDKGLTVVDFSDPYRPLISGTFDTIGFSHEVVPADGRVFVADGIGGLLILEKAAASERTAMPLALDLETTRPPTTLGHSPRLPAASPPPSVAGAVAPDSHLGRTLSTSTCVVTSAADSGTGTLRSCLANGSRGVTITFDPVIFPKSSPVTIQLGSALPGLTWGNATIDASNAGVILDGGAISQSTTPGLLHIVSDGNTIRGLQILRYPNNGIEIDGSTNIIGGDRTRGEGNVISGNGRHAIAINGSYAGASSNTVIGNLIGTDASGTKPLGNGHDAVFLSGASNSRIGGLEPGERNIISGNAGSGITVAGRKTSENALLGNYCGTDVTGTVALPNTNSGITIEGGGSNNRIEGNLLSGNQGAGITIGDWDACYNAVVGNRIGTDSTGTKALANGLGVYVVGGGSFNRIGGLRPEERNIISGNRHGITVQGPATVGNLVLGNFIGTDITGGQALGNENVGVALTGDSRSIVGGATPREANVISASGAEGVGVISDYNFVAGNYIGTDSSGEIAMGNQWWWAVRVLGAHNTIQSNVIANSESGVLLNVSSRTPVRRNSIHTNKGKGILYTAANVPIAAPVITKIDTTAVSGTACPGCEVEIFSDADGEGRRFEGSVVADASGSFTFTTQRFLTGPNVTATATDVEGNTSEFSVPRAAPPPPPRRRAVRHR